METYVSRFVWLHLPFRNNLANLNMYFTVLALCEKRIHVAAFSMWTLNISKWKKLFEKNNFNILII